MKVTVVGAGYVGLTTAVALAWVGHDVQVVEVDQRKLEGLRSGRSPFFEPHLDEAMRATRERLKFAGSVEQVLVHAEVAFIAVGTPAGPDGASDLGQVDGALGQLLGALPADHPGLVIVMKSTVPVGTGDRIAQQVVAAGLGDRVVIASNPEFLRQGRALRDSLYPDRIVLGGSSVAFEALRRLYSPIQEQAFEPPDGLEPPQHRSIVPILEVDRRSAEMAKYAANAYLAMRISFINEIANLCDHLGADVDAVASVIGADPRIGHRFLHAGIGFGGSCFPKDTRALYHLGATNGYDPELLSAVIRVNENQRNRVMAKLEASLGDVAGKRVVLLGLAFKPGTEDMREAPSIPLAEALLERGALVCGHDPLAVENARAVLPSGVALFTDVHDALRSADAAVLLTEWPEYLALPAHAFRASMRRPLLVDGRNALSESVRRELEYYGIGRQPTVNVPELIDAIAAD